MRLSREQETDESGFTLVELLVSMVVMFVLLGVTFSAVTTSNSAVVTTAQQQGLNEEARQAINRMARDIFPPPYRESRMKSYHLSSDCQTLAENVRRV